MRNSFYVYGSLFSFLDSAKIYTQLAFLIVIISSKGVTEVFYLESVTL